MHSQSSQSSSAFTLFNDEIFIHIALMLDLHEKAMFVLTCQYIQSAITDYEKGMQIYFPSEYKAFALESKRAQLSLDEEKKNDRRAQKDLSIVFKPAFRKAFQFNYDGLTNVQIRFFSLFKLGDLSRIKQTHPPLDYLQTQISHEYDLVIDSHKLGLLHWAWINKHQHVLDYCYAIFSRRNVLGRKDPSEELYWAMICQQSQEKVNELLLSPGANRNADIDLGHSIKTLLQIASKHGYLEVVKALISNGGNRIKSYEISKAIHNAIQNCHFKIIQYLSPLLSQKKKEKYFSDLIVEAVIRNQIEVVEYFFSLHKINDSNTLSMLMQHAVQEGHLDMIQYLHDKHGVHINTEIMTYAISGKQGRVIKLIVDLKNNQRENPHCADVLMTAVSMEEEDVVRFLFQENLAKLNAVTAEGTTAIRCAVMRGELQVVQYLIEQKADVQVVANDGTTLLMDAVDRDHVTLVEYLLPESNVNAQTHRKTTALMCAVTQGNLTTVKLLIEKKADVNAVAEDGTTVLMCAANQGYFEIVRFLVEENQANFKVAAKDGTTALIKAAEKGSYEIVDYLISLQSDSDLNVTKCLVVLKQAAFRGRHHAKWIDAHKFLIQANVPDKFFDIARLLISQPAIVIHYFSDKKNNLIPMGLMKIIHHDVLSFCKQRQNYLSPLCDYFNVYKKEANNAEVLCANLLIVMSKKQTPETHNKLIYLIETLLQIEKFVKIVSCFFIDMLQEIHRSLRQILKSQSSEEQKPLNENRVNPYLSFVVPAQNQIKTSSSFWSKYSIFNCCSNDSATIDEKNERVEHTPSPVPSRSK